MFPLPNHHFIVLRAKEHKPNNHLTLLYIRLLYIFVDLKTTKSY
jgi:hypothetical protein